MAETKTVNLEVNSNLNQTEQAVTSLRSELRKAQEDVAVMSEKFGATSKEAVEAAKRAAELKDRMGDAKSLTDAFNPDAKFKSLTGALSGAAGGLSAVTGAMGILGTESKEVEQMILKVQSAMAISQGVQAVGESIDAFKQLGAVVKSFTIVQNISAAAQRIWNAAMAANPIGVIVVAVTALIAAGYALVNMFIASSDATKKAEAANKALNKELETQVKNQKAAAQETELSRDLQLGMAKASGKSAAEIRKLAVELANQEVTQKLANAQTLRAIAIEAQRVAGLEDATDAQKETAKKARKEFDDANNALKTSVLNRRKLLNENKIAETQEATNAREKEAEETKKANADAKSKRDDATKKQLDDIKKANADKLAEEKKLNDDKRKLFEDSIKKAFDLEKELNQSQETPAEKENREYLEKKKILEDQYLSTEILDKQHKEKLLQISNEAFAADADLAIQDTANKKANADAEIKIEEEKQAAKERALQAYSSGLKTAATLLGESTAAGKAAAIAATTIDTIQSGVSAFKGMVAAVPGPAGIALGSVAAAGALASGYASVKKILAVKTPNGGGGAASPSTGGSAAPQFNVVGQGGANQIAQGMAQQNMEPVQAYVVSGAVTTSQALNRNIINNASMG